MITQPNQVQPDQLTPQQTAAVGRLFSRLREINRAVRERQAQVQTS